MRRPSYRPLCMISTGGKVLEKLIQPRIMEEVKTARVLKKQYRIWNGIQYFLRSSNDLRDRANENGC